MSKKVLFDLVATQPSGSTKRHGGGRYGEIIFFRMAARDIKFSAYYDSQRWLNPDVQKVIKEKQIPLYDVSKTPLKDIVKDGGFTTVYSALPCADIIGIQDKNVTKIGTIHGLRGIEMPLDDIYFHYRSSFSEKVRFFTNQVLHSWRKKRAINFYKTLINSDLEFITVSNHSCSSIKSYYPEYKKNISVYFSPNTSSVYAAPKRTDTGMYFLMVSGNRWEKNNLRAIIAFDRLVTHGLVKGIKAVVTGCSSQDFCYKIKNPDAFIFHGYVEETVLEDLYANAYLFVYPSLNEGFGYPPLEAMRYGVPVIASPFSSISEVLEGAALYFNPLSIEEIMSRMLLMLDKERHDKYAQLGLEKYAAIKERQDSDLDALIDYISE